MLFGAALVFLYVLSRAVLPLGCGVKRKILLGAGVFLLSFKFQLMRRIAGPMFFAPDLPNGILVAATWCYAVFFLFFLLLVVADLCRLVWWIIGKIRRRPKSKSTVYAVNLALLTAAAFLASTGMVNSLRPPKLRTVEARYPTLPPELEGFRIVLLADLHLDKLSPPEFLPGVVRRVNALAPDLAALAGDFADGPAARIAPKLLPLKNLRAKCGVYAVPGNHEYYSGYQDYVEYLAKLDMTVLENSHRLAAPKLAVAGVTDPAARLRNLPMPDLDAALDGIPADAFVLLLAHNPACAHEAARRHVDLQLSGHTHGGLMRGFDHLVALFNGGFVSGLYQLGRMKLYVSRGTSLWKGFPVRLGVPSEITIITLRRAK